MYLATWQRVHNVASLKSKVLKIELILNSDDEKIVHLV